MMDVPRRRGYPAVSVAGAAASVSRVPAAADHPQRGPSMSTSPSHTPTGNEPATSRRDFLQQAAGLAAGLTALAAIPAAPAAEPTTGPLLPTIKLGPHEVTRLIIGGNPIYGYSHFNRLLSQHQTAWHTPER